MTDLVEANVKAAQRTSVPWCNLWTDRALDGSHGSLPRLDNSVHENVYVRWKWLFLLSECLFCSDAGHGNGTSLSIKANTAMLVQTDFIKKSSELFPVNKRQEDILNGSLDYIGKLVHACMTRALSWRQVFLFSCSVSWKCRANWCHFPGVYLVCRHENHFEVKSQRLVAPSSFLFCWKPGEATRQGGTTFFSWLQHSAWRSLLALGLIGFFSSSSVRDRILFFEA